MGNKLILRILAILRGVYGVMGPTDILIDSLIADSALQQAFAAATGNFRPFSALKSIHI